MVFYFFWFFMFMLHIICCLRGECCKGKELLCLLEKTTCCWNRLILLYIRIALIVIVLHTLVAGMRFLVRWTDAICQKKKRCAFQVSFFGLLLKFYVRQSIRSVQHAMILLFEFFLFDYNDFEEKFIMQIYSKNTCHHF